MDKILNWSLAQQDPETAGKVPAPDSKLLAKLFGAADDPQLMKEAIAVVQSEEAELETKLTALENFEMLIENLDNANNIENMKMWDAIIDLLSLEKELELQQLACSIVGTAVQNNDKSQADFTKYPQGVPSLIALAHKKESRLKSLYALSSLIRNNTKAYESFDEHKGWELIGPILSDDETDNKTKLRSLSLLSSILSSGKQEDVWDHIRQYDIVIKLASLISKENDISLVDKAINIIVELIRAGFKFTDSDRKVITEKVGFIETELMDVVNLDDVQILRQVTL
ncbi:Hsp70 nucleotide exchange factor FES1 [Cyberlindnera jadinii NRRL Y-1542]|uniref:Hsp70 nucleotide exchange factor FES1 n=1 Tax=Cyberlindnera jadinii (strain ATCC 18201 / CBS 1600 / BCRC 20928 / JCM 3617 / NBRC 0987 / NRRL Y-1542) TaxID=983966 RepID=A0A1E4S444_CYBJN|nr:Fes1-domain-containing protein [Cyberlindnera jadinii NRRL Y-1542]ODV74297.1 Fes1-domain-containing protein [Cyberlindnera jadinii NRRL Y-1542]